MVQRVTNDDDSVGFEFIDSLPPHARARWRDILKRLYPHPGQWARVRFGIPRKAVSAVAFAINHHRWSGQGNKAARMTPPGIFRAAIRDGHLYVCFCGPEPEQAK